MAPMQPPIPIKSELWAIRRTADRDDCDRDELPTGVTLVDPDELIEIAFLERGELEPRVYGHLAAERALGELQLRLTYDKAKGLWWILVSEQGDGALFENGYLLENREKAWQTFAFATSDEVRSVLMVDVAPAN